MKVTQEKRENSQVGLQIEVTADVTSKYYEEQLNNLSRNANIPGFRKGKIPRQVILQRMGQKYVKAMTVEALMEKTLPQAIKQEQIQAIGNYQILSDYEELINTFQPGQPFTFNAAVDVPPEVKVENYQGLQIQAEEIVYKPEDVDNFLEERRKEKATLIPVERSAQMDDILLVNFSGKYPSGEEISGAQAEDFEMELAPERFISDLVNGIVGMNAQETKEIPVKFPEDYGNKDLAGVDAIFTVTVQEVKEKELPALDDDFAASVSDYDTIAAFRESLEKDFQEKATKGTNNNIKTAIEKALIELTVVDLPESMIEDETMKILNQMAMQFSQYGMDINKLFNKDTIPQIKKNTRPDAINNLKLTLALEAIAKEQNITPDPEAIATRLAEVLTQLAGEQVDEKRLNEFVTEDVTKEQTIDWLKERAKIELLPEGSLSEEEDEEDENPENIEMEVVEESIEIVETTIVDN